MFIAYKIGQNFGKLLITNLWILGHLQFQITFYCITMTAVLTIPLRCSDNNDFRLLLKESFLISRDSEILLFLIRTLHRSWPENWLKPYNSIKLFLIFDNFHLFCIPFVANFSYIIKTNISSQLSDIFNIDLYSGVFPSVLKN